MQARRYQGTRLLPVIEARGTTATWVGRKIGVDPSQMHHVMRGRRTLPEAQAEAVAALFGLPVLVIFDLAPARKPRANEPEAALTAAD